ncbi:hypothetical protein CCP3SC1AL1_950009 [Gammaproteobacteria bacterium]
MVDIEISKNRNLAAYLPLAERLKSTKSNTYARTVMMFIKRLFCQNTTQRPRQKPH